MMSPNQIVRIVAVTAIMTIIAAIHIFRIGSYLEGNMYTLYYSFASDMMLPFGAYFLLSVNEIQMRFLRKWLVKVLIVFGVMTTSEVMQLFGIYIFGVTFDILDILMYAIGAGSAVLIETFIFQRYIPNWEIKES